jgi:uncharacterized protein (TIGR03437 family)
MQLSQTELTFAAVTGVNAAVPGQTISVYNLGSGGFSWTVQSPQYLPANVSGWLTMSATSGTSSGTTAGELTATVNAAALAQGQYYATVAVASPGAANGQQSFTVLLNVVNAGDLGSTPQVFSSGGILAVPAGSSANATQTINLFNPAGQSLSYSTAVYTGSSGSQWLTVGPASGSVAGGANSTITVSASAAGMTAGILNGTVQVAFSEGTVATLPFALVVLPGTGTSSAERANASTVCSPNQLAVVLSAPAGGTPFVVGQGGRVAVQISDNCNVVTPTSNNGNLTIKLAANKQYQSVTFLYDAENAVWTGTWVPANAQNGAELEVFASIAGSGAVGSFSGESAPVTVNVLPNDPANSPPQATPPLNAASFAQTAQGIVVPGEYVSIFGENLANQTAGGGVPLPGQLGGAQLSMNSLPVPLLSVSQGQLNGLVPQQLAAGAPATLSLQRGNTAAPVMNATVAEFQPGIFTLSATGVGQGAIVNYEAGVVAGAGPGQQAVSRGGVIEIYATGLGAVVANDGSNTAPPGDGQPAPFPPASPLFKTQATVSVTIGGVPVPAANVLFAGLAPGFIALYQINVLVPAAVPAGTAEPVVITLTDAAGNSASSQAGVTIAVQ